MEKAGEGIAVELLGKYGSTVSYNFACGLGNNGGDGFAAARYLIENGAKNVRVYLLGRVSDLKSTAAKEHWKLLQDLKSENLTVKSDAFARDR